MLECTRCCPVRQQQIRSISPLGNSLFESHFKLEGQMLTVQSVAWVENMKNCPCQQEAAALSQTKGMGSCLLSCCSGGDWDDRHMWHLMSHLLQNYSTAGSVRAGERLAGPSWSCFQFSCRWQQARKSSDWIVLKLLVGSLLQGILTITVWKYFWQGDPLLPPLQDPFVPSLHLLSQRFWTWGSRSIWVFPVYTVYILRVQI